MELLLVCMTAVFLVAAFGQRVNVIGDSMSPVLKNGNVVMINHFIYNIKDPSRGDIAAFQKDGDERYFVKRIVGLPERRCRSKKENCLSTENR
ncbi:signal peptidase I [[Ruminococcus] torques]|nr:signal peptidase I [[Ruminococcus] torques]